MSPQRRNCSPRPAQSNSRWERTRKFGMRGNADWPARSHGTEARAGEVGRARAHAGGVWVPKPMQQLQNLPEFIHPLALSAPRHALLLPGPALWAQTRNITEKQRWGVINGANPSLWRSHSASAPVTGHRPPNNRRSGKLSYLLFYTKSRQSRQTTKRASCSFVTFASTSVIEKKMSHCLAPQTIVCVCVCVWRPFVRVHFL